VECGVLFVQCQPLFPESGMVSVKAPFEFSESFAFSCEPLVSFFQSVFLLGGAPLSVSHAA
jgi:hypothetical protein